MMTMNRDYRTLEDMLFGNGGPLEGEEGTQQDLEMGNDIYDSVNGTLFSSLVHWYFEIGTVDSFWDESTVASAKRYINVLFCRYIYPKYKDMAVAYGETTQEVDRAQYKFLIHLMNRIRTTYDEHKILIDAFEQEKGNLLNEVKVINTNKLNLTPQTSGSVYDDSYQNQISTNETKSDGATKIQRIAEIDALIRDYYDKWCKTVCKGLFIYE